MFTIQNPAPNVPTWVTMTVRRPIGLVSLHYHADQKILGLREWPAYVAEMEAQAGATPVQTLLQQGAEVCAGLLGVPVTVSLHAGDTPSKHAALSASAGPAGAGEVVATPELSGSTESVTGAFVQLCPFSNEPQPGSTITLTTPPEHVPPTADLEAFLLAMASRTEPVELEGAVQDVAMHYQQQGIAPLHVDAHCLLSFGLHIQCVVHLPAP